MLSYLLLGWGSGGIGVVAGCLPRGPRLCLLRAVKNLCIELKKDYYARVERVCFEKDGGL